MIVILYFVGRDNNGSLSCVSYITCWMCVVDIFLKTIIGSSDAIVVCAGHTTA